MISATPEDDSTSVDNEPDDILDLSSSRRKSTYKDGREDSEYDSSDGQREIVCSSEAKENINEVVESLDGLLKNARLTNEGENNQAKKARTKIKKNSAEAREHHRLINPQHVFALGICTSTLFNICTGF